MKYKNCAWPCLGWSFCLNRFLRKPSWQFVGRNAPDAGRWVWSSLRAELAHFPRAFPRPSNILQDRFGRSFRRFGHLFWDAVSAGVCAVQQSVCVWRGVRGLCCWKHQDRCPFRWCSTSTHCASQALFYCLSNVFSGSCIWSWCCSWYDDEGTASRLIFYQFFVHIWYEQLWDDFKFCSEQVSVDLCSAVLVVKICLVLVLIWFWKFSSGSFSTKIFLFIIYFSCNNSSSYLFWCERHNLTKCTTIYMYLCSATQVISKLHFQKPILTDVMAIRDSSLLWAPYKSCLCMYVCMISLIFEHNVHLFLTFLVMWSFILTLVF